MSKVDGIGGVFLKANDPAKLARWYEDHFGLALSCWEEGKNYGLELFQRADDGSNRRISTIFSIQKAARPLDPEHRHVVLNWRVQDLNAFLADLDAKGVRVEKGEPSEYGLFAWIVDGEGNRIELYQPAEEPGTS